MKSNQDIDSFPYLGPVHVAGNVGNDNTVLTVSKVYDEGDILSAIEFSGASPNDKDAIKKWDTFFFVKTDGYEDIRFCGIFPSDFGKPTAGFEFYSKDDYCSDEDGVIKVELMNPHPYFIDYFKPEEVKALSTKVIPGMRCNVYPSHRVFLNIPEDLKYLETHK